MLFILLTAGFIEPSLAGYADVEEIGVSYPVVTEVDSIIVSDENYSQNAKKELIKPFVKQGEYGLEAIKALIDYYADKHGVSRETMHKVVKCESSYNPNAVNWQDSHKLSQGSHGVAQFSKQTFEQYSKQMGKSHYDDPYNPEQALDVMGFMLSINQGKHWTCYRNLK